MDHLFLISLLAVITFLPTKWCQTDKKNFGTYKMDWLTYESCKGPKREECGLIRIDNKNISNVLFHLDFPRDCPVTMGRITIGTKQKNEIHKLFNYALDSPCQHFAMGPLLIRAFNLTKGCKVNKGKYTVHINMMEESKRFLGDHFFYGTFDFRVMAYNSVNNFFCVHSTLTTYKDTERTDSST